VIGYVIRRLLVSVLAVWGAATVVFLVIRIIPGDAVAIMAAEGGSTEAIEAARARLGLDKPILIQYLVWLPQLLTFDFGNSWVSRQPVIELVAQRLPNTAWLAFSAIIVAVLIGIPVGILAGKRPGSLVDRVVSVLSLVGQSVPPFWVGIMLLLVFARQLQWLPSMGSGTLSHLILPAVTLALPLIAILVRMVRQGILEVLGSGYVEAARGKGLTERVVMYRHVLKNTMIPVVTILGLQFGGLLTGSVLVETIYSWPGIGNLLISSIYRRDYPTIQAVMLFVAVIFVAVNFVVDLVYGYLDPRVRLEDKQ
jgi:peptide/nickel transport system permease protein